MKRVITGAAWTVMLGVMWFFQGTVMRVLLAAMMMEGMWEMYRAYDQHGDHTYWWPGMLFAALSMPAYVFLGWEAACVLLLLCCIIGMTCVILHGKADFSALVATVFPLLYPGMMFLLLFRMQDFEVACYASLSILLVFLVPSACDVAAYEVGSRWGRHKLCPELSPGKTIEGAVAGLIASIVAAGVVSALFPALQELAGGALEAIMPPLWHMLVLGAVSGFAAQCGDLVASLVKRRCGIKDYAQILPGHGGLMDRMDSSLLCTVVVFGYFWVRSQVVL